MLIVGAKGFAKEVLEICHQNDELQDLVFFDDVSTDIDDKLFNTFPILKSIEEAKNYFNTIDNRFTIGIGNPQLRKKMYDKFSSIGGVYTSTISKNAIIGSYNVEIGNGSNVLCKAVFSNSSKIGVGCIVYYDVKITHDCIVKDFVELSPGVTLLGHVQIGNFCQLGSNCTILPKVTIGDNSIIGAGAVVSKDIPANSVAVGIPAKVIKTLVV